MQIINKKSFSHQCLTELVQQGVSRQQLVAAVKSAQIQYRAKNRCPIVWQTTLENELQRVVESARLPWNTWYGTALTASEALVWETVFFASP